MSHFRLHTNTKGREYLKYLMSGFLCLMSAAAVGYGIHSIGQALARSRETVLIYTEEEFAQYLLDQESGEYNLNGSYQLEENLDLKNLEHSIGTNVEPFTGKLDGNGHVIRGLVRPLFGVMMEAEVENLFLSEAEILHPFTYYDGEHYVDGYGALAAYAVDSVIRNCGMGGEIHMASPVEAEYQVAKASPAEALEEKGPGETEAVTDGDVTGEGGSGNSGSGGPGMEPGTEEESGIESETDGGPGIETETGEDQGTSEDAETESGSLEGSVSESETSTGMEPEPGVNGGTGTESGTAGGSGTESGDGDEPGSEPVTTGSQTGESGGSIEGIETKGETESGVESGTDGKSETDQEVNSGTGVESGTNTEKESGSGMETKSDHGANGNPGSSQAAGETGNGANTEENRQIDKDATAETIGYQSNDRQYLMMKISSASEMGPGIESETDLISVASPSDATPAEAEELEESLFPDGPEEPESMENPEGDRYVRVTADRITAGGLVAETTGSTLISDSFVLVTIGARLENTDACAGGLAGILGESTRTENSYASGLMEYEGMAGGFAAVNRGVVQNCYSTVTVGRKGTIRGAFVAEDTGAISDCVYDWQMASVTEEMGEDSPIAVFGEETVEHTDPGSGVTGLEIASMTGLEAQVPGNWYLAEQAYPQIEYFTGSEDETISSYSKASVISLSLPSGMTLLELHGGSDIQLPSEIDGQPIQWDAKGGAIINENNQAKIENGEITISPKDVPVVGTALDQETKQTSEQETAAGEETITAETTANETASSGVVFEATVGTATRTILGNTMTAAAAATPTTWTEVGNLRYTNNQPASGSGNANDPFKLGTPEDLAWFMVYVNNNHYDACAELTADIDLSGADNYGFSESSPMPWGIIAPGSHGSAANAYSGTFDGKYHTISSMYYYGTSPQAGFIGVLTGVVQNLYLDKVTVISANPTYRFVCIGGLAGMTVEPGKVQRCGILSGLIEAENATTTGFMGIGGVVGDHRASDTQIIDCFNRADVTCHQTNPKSAYIGGIAGRSFPMTKGITNSYSTGKITADAGIVGTWTGVASIPSNEGIQYPVNCYIEDGSVPSVTDYAKTLSKGDLQSWDACYALNGKSKTGPWKYNEGDYPDFGRPNNPHTGTIGNPSDWSQIGRGIETGLVDFITQPGLSQSEDGTAANPYHISTPEQLAHFAYKVNQGNSGLYAELTADINLSGTAYTGITYDQSGAQSAGNALKWIPIGQDTNGSANENAYTGYFQGNGHIITQLHAEGDGKQGLFGTVKGSGRISGTGIEGGYITGLEAGSIAGRLDGAAAISRCFNRQKTYISSLARDNASAGGIAGQMAGVSLIEDSYSLMSTIASSGGSSHVGGIAGRIGPNAIIQNSYKAQGTLRASGTNALAGSICGYVESGGVIRQCYRDGALSGEGTRAGVSDFNMLDDSARQQETDQLNTLNDSSGIGERTGTNRVWYTSLASEDTFGLPTLIPPVSISITMPPADSGGGSTVSLPSTLTDAKFRGLHQELGNADPAFELTSRTDVGSNFNNYGTDNAGKYLGLSTGDGTDFWSLSPSITSPTESAGTISSLILYTGAAYTCAKDRVLLLDVLSGGKRYEIRITIPKVEFNTLSIVLPVKVVMEDLVPTGTDEVKKTFSPNLLLRNNSKYPIVGKITGVSPRTGAGYVTLKPVAQSDPYGDTKQLTDPDGGVKLGIADGGKGIIPSGGLYYTPANPAANPAVEEKWMGYKLRGLEELDYQYFIEYEGSHYLADNQYEYTVTYEFGISKDDVYIAAVE